MAEEKKKSRVDDINRSVYDIKDEVEFSYKADQGLTADIVRKISAEKGEPLWMLEKRLQALRIYESLDVPTWAPDISELDMDHIDTYIRPKTDMKVRWEDLPQNIRDTFDRLGIPEAEKKSLAGVGAQYDSEVVYHNVQKELKEQGYSLKIWDAYRPFEAQQKLWEVYPDPNYVANPANGMKKHNIGGTVDITMVTADGSVISMPTEFDDFSLKADRDYSDIEDEEAVKNVMILQNAMENNGFTGYQGEWWDYSDTVEYEAVDFEP